MIRAQLVKWRFVGLAVLLGLGSGSAFVCAKAKKDGVLSVLPLWVMVEVSPLIDSDALALEWTRRVWNERSITDDDRIHVMRRALAGNALARREDPEWSGSFGRLLRSATLDFHRSRNGAWRDAYGNVLSSPMATALEEVVLGQPYQVTTHTHSHWPRGVGIVATADVAACGPELSVLIRGTWRSSDGASGEVPLNSPDELIELKGVRGPGKVTVTFDWELLLDCGDGNDPPVLARHLEEVLITIGGVPEDVLTTIRSASFDADLHRRLHVTPLHKGILIEPRALVKPLDESEDDTWIIGTLAVFKGEDVVVTENVAWVPPDGCRLLLELPDGAWQELKGDIESGDVGRWHVRLTSDLVAACHKLEDYQYWVGDVFWPISLPEPGDWPPNQSRMSD